MKTIALHEVVISIKEAVAELNLSQKEFQKLVFEKTGVWLSDATVSRLLANGSENKGFNFAKTLDPAQRALKSVSSTENANPHGLYESALLYKDAEIEDLTAEIEEIKAAYEKELQKYRKRIDDLRNEYEARIDYVRHQNDDYINHLCDQISIKDKRMDWKDEMIKQLLEQVLVCGHCPVEKKK